MFGALFAVYAAYYPAFEHDFRAAAHHNTLWKGTINTYVLATSSFTSALAVWAIGRGRPRLASEMLWLTILLGATFLGIKAWEYLEHFHQGIYPGRMYAFEKLPTRGATIFFTLYYLLTFLHIIHLSIGILVMLLMIWSIRRASITADYHVSLELGAMYWSLVDLIWLAIWPTFYLIR
jgi:cytochrome c oxidase subunit 3